MNDYCDQVNYNEERADRSLKQQQINCRTDRLQVESQWDRLDD